jgi:hypothetical protein
LRPPRQLLRGRARLLKRLCLDDLADQRLSMLARRVLPVPIERRRERRVVPVRLRRLLLSKLRLGPNIRPEKRLFVVDVRLRTMLLRALGRQCPTPLDVDPLAGPGRSEPRLPLSPVNRSKERRRHSTSGPPSRFSKVCDWAPACWFWLSRCGASAVRPQDY